MAGHDGGLDMGSMVDWYMSPSGSPLRMDMLPTWAGEVGRQPPAACSFRPPDKVMCFPGQPYPVT